MDFNKIRHEQQKQITINDMISNLDDMLHEKYNCDIWRDLKTDLTMVHERKSGVKFSISDQDAIIECKRLGYDIRNLTSDDFTNVFFNIIDQKIIELTGQKQQLEINHQMDKDYKEMNATCKCVTPLIVHNTGPDFIPKCLTCDKPINPFKSIT